MTDPRRVFLLVPITFLVAGCYDQAFVPGDEATDRIEITNDEFELEQRVLLLDEEIAIDPDAGLPAFASFRHDESQPLDGLPARMGPRRDQITLRLRGEAAPPVVDGQITQATSVAAARGKNKAIVSYGMIGSAALGGVDLFKIERNGRPKLKSSASFLDADVLAVSFDDNYAYTAQASSDPARPAPAVVGRFLTRGHKFTLDGLEHVQLGSFAATSTAHTGSIVYATSGNDGSVYAIDQSDLSILGEFALDDARWVAHDKDNGRIAVAQGTPGRISVFAEGMFQGGSLSLLNTFAFPGADVASSKSTVEVLGGKAFVAAGPEGVQVVCLNNGQIVGSVPRPDPASLGLDPSVVVTNAVTVQDDLMFISNGEAGVYVAVGAESFETSDCDEPQMITVLGQMQFDDLESVNHVVYKDNQLWIAAGLGGIKIVDVRVRR
jgi:hypothetical protein